MKHSIRSVVIILAILIFAFKSEAQQVGDFGTATTGNWSDVSNWVVCETNGRWDDASPAGSLPTTTDRVIIRDGHTITINQNVSIAQLTVGEGLSGILSFDATTGRSFTVSGNITVAAGGVFTVFQAFTPTGDIASGSNVITNVSSTAGIGTLWNISGTGLSGATVSLFDATTITASVLATATTPGALLSIKPTLANTMSIGGNLTNNGTFDMSLGSSTTVCNVTFTSSGTQSISGTSPVTTRFRNISLNKSAQANKVTSSISVTGASGIFVAPFIGTWEQTAGTLSSTSGSVSIPATGGLLLTGTGGFTGVSNLNNLGILTVNTDGTLALTGTGKIDCGNVATAFSTFTKGTINIPNLTTGASSTVTINGANFNIDPQNIAATATAFSFNSTTNGTLSSGTVTILNPITAVGAGFEIGTAALTAMSGSFTFVLGQGASTVASLNGGFRIKANSANYYNNLVINTGSVGVTLSSNIFIKGKATFISHGTLNLNAFGFRYTANGTVEYNGTAAQTTSDFDFISTTSYRPSNVIINNSAGVTLHAARTIQGTLTLTSGNLALNSFALTVGAALPAMVFTGTTAIGSVSVTGIASTTGTVLGAKVTGTGIPVGAYVTTFGSTSITLSAAATAAGTISITVDPTEIIGSVSQTSGFVTGTGTVTRWFGTNAVTLGTSAGLFPVGIGSNNRSLWIGGTPSVMGTVSVQYNDASTSSKPFAPSFDELSQTYLNRYDANWVVTTANSFAGTGLSLQLQGSGIGGIVNILDVNISGPTGPANGSLFNTSGTTAHPLVSRNGFTESTLAGTYYIATTSSSPLPVVLQSFTARSVQGRIEISWSTASEVNNTGFEIEKNINGSWVKIGFEEGHGTSNAPHSYSFIDRSAKGMVSYRLKQIDRDGKFTYSNVVEAHGALTAEDFTLSQNYPNPFNPSTTFSFGVRTAEMVNVSVYNMLGQKVATLFNGIATPNELYSLTFNGGGLASGTYIYSLRSASRNEIKKMLLTK